MTTAAAHRAPAAPANDGRDAAGETRPRAARAPYEPYRSTLLSPPRVRELSRLRPQRVVADSAACWLGILAAWVAVACWPRWWVVLLAIPVIGTRYYGLFIIGHDGLHRRLFPGRTGNDRFNDLVILGPIGAVTRLNRVNHIDHHDHLATRRDPDRHRHACFNKADRPALFGYLTGLTSVWRSMSNVFVSHAARGRPAGPAAAERSYRKRDVAVLAGWQALLLGGLGWSIGWWAYPVLWLAPVFLFTVLGDNLRSFLEHSHPERDDAADRHRLITFVSHPLERALLAPMNMNYHTVHHLWPSIPYYNLPEADAEVRDRPGARGLIRRTSYLAYLWRYFLALPLEDCRVSTEPDSETERNLPRASIAAGSPDSAPPAEFGRRRAPRIPEEPVPACPVCRAASFAPHALGFDYEMLTCGNPWRFVRCRGCGHVWLNPRPAVSALPAIYPADYYAYNYRRISSLALRGKAVLDALKMRWIARHGPAVPEGYLDIGCGDGRYLRAMERRGVPRARLYGLELDRRSVDTLAAQGYHAFRTRVEDCDALPEGAMDLVTMFHVIEHLDDPAGAVRRITRWLAPGGILAVETPNLDSLDARLFRRGFWGGYHIPRHFHVFTTETLARLLSESGLEVLAVRYQTGHSFWMYSFHHALRFGRRPLPRLAAAFDPLASLPLLIAFTAFDTLRARLGFRTSSVLMVARRPPAR